MQSWTWRQRRDSEWNCGGQEVQSVSCGGRVVGEMGSVSCRGRVVGEEGSAVFHPDIVARGSKMAYAINKGGVMCHVGM